MSKPTVYSFGSFRLDLSERQLFRDGSAVMLQRRAFETLVLLVENSGRVVEKEQFFQTIWRDAEVEDGSLTVNISLLRKVLGDDQNGNKFIETIPRRGYRFVAPVYAETVAAIEDVVAAEAEISQPAAPIETPPENLPAPPTVSADRQALRFSRRPVAVVPVIVVSVIVVLLALGMGYAIWPKRSRTISLSAFQNLNNEAQMNHVGLSLTEKVKREFVNASCKDLTLIASEPRVTDYEIEGSYGKRAGKWEITVFLKDVKSGGYFWQKDFHAPEPNLPALLDKVARDVLVHACSQQTAPKRQIAPEAYALFSQGVDKYRNEDFESAAALLEKCVARDAQYTAAWTYLGSSYIHLASSGLKGEAYYQKAQAAYEKAMALDPDDLRPRIQLGMMLTETNRAEKAVELLKEVLSRHPESAEAQWELGYAYRYAGLLEESLELSRRAIASDPGFHDLYSFPLAQLYLGDYRGLLVNEEIVKGNAYLTFYRGLAHYYLKEFPQAKAAFDSAYESGRKQLQARIGKALSYGLEKKTQAGLVLLFETEQIISRGGNSDPEGIYRLAQGYAVLGDRAAALRSLQRSIEGGFFCYPYLRDDPLLQNIRNEPQVASLLETARQRHEAFVRQFTN